MGKNRLAQLRPESHVATRIESPTQLIEPAGRHVRLLMVTPAPQDACISSKEQSRSVRFNEERLLTEQFTLVSSHSTDPSLQINQMRNIGEN